MLYFLSELSGELNVLNVFRYQTFRAGGAVITALAVAMLCGPAIIRWLKTKQPGGQPIRVDGPESHIITKAGTPTMGGVMMLLGIAVATLLWADLRNQFVWIALFVTMGYGIVGSLDDYRKVTKRSASEGLSGRTRMMMEIAIALVAAIWIGGITSPALSDVLAIPFVGSPGTELEFAL